MLASLPIGNCADGTADERRCTQIQSYIIIHKSQIQRRPVDLQMETLRQGPDSRRLHRAKCKKVHAQEAAIAGALKIGGDHQSPRAKNPRDRFDNGLLMDVPGIPGIRPVLTSGSHQNSC